MTISERKTPEVARCGKDEREPEMARWKKGKRKRKKSIFKQLDDRGWL